MRSLQAFRMLTCLGVMLVGVSCGNGSTDHSWFPGQTDFVNNEPASSYYGGWRGEDDGYAAGECSGGACGTPSTSNDANKAVPGAPQGRTGTVEEADIYKVENNKLFYLNTYRGFIIYDLSDPKKPQQISRLPVFGYPIEMFIQGTTVYALIRDALYLSQVKGKLQFKRHNTSQLVAIDISDMKNPKVLQTVDIIGQLREGVSRKIEDTIYVVSYRDRYYYYDWGYYYDYNQPAEKEQAWVYSFNVANPKDLKLVDQLQVFEGGQYSYHDKNYNTSVSRYFNDVTISATSNALMVVENWNTYGYISGSKYNCGSSFSQQQAIVSVIDVSDPQGKIRLHTKFDTYGELGDQFKMTYNFDDKTKKGTFLGIFARREWSSSSCSGTSLVQNTLESWDITDGSNPKRVSELAFGKPNETVRGSVFDADRSVAFAITARSVDPLYAISFADPTSLKILSAVDGLSGDMNVFRFIEGKKFLIGIGRDNSTLCTGFGDPSVTGTQVAVSVIDVQDLSKIRLVQRKCVAVQNASWVNSELNWNLDQAHKMIGMHSDGTVNAITVPIYYYTKTGPSDWYYYHYQTAVGLMTWDLAKYDPTKSELDQQVLENYGTIIHPKGEVRRSIVFSHKTTQTRRMVLNLSNTHLSLVDVTDLKNPDLQSVVEVAPYYDQLYRFVNDATKETYVVEHIRPTQYTYSYGGNSENASEFRVVKVGSGPLEETTAVASFTVGQVERVVKHNSNLVLFRRVYNKDPNKPYYYSYDVELVVYDLSDPTKPTKKGTTLMTGPIMPSYWYWCGLDTYWGGYWFDYYSSYGNSWVVTDKGLSFLATYYNYDYKTYKSTYTRKLVFVDLSNTSAPTLKDVTLTSSQSWTFFSLIPDPNDTNAFYLSYRTKIGEIEIDGSTFYQYKYYAQRWLSNPTGWASDAAINLPGRLMKTWEQGTTKERMFLTHDYTYQKMPSTSSGKYYYPVWQYSFRLNLLRQVSLWGAPLGELLDFHNFQSYYLKDVIVDSSSMKPRLYINARHDYTYNQQNKIAWQDVSDYLMIYDLSGMKLVEKYAEPTGTYTVHLMGTYKDKLFISLPGDGVLVVDVTDASQPNGVQFLRTLGYTTHIEFVAPSPGDDRALLASGYFGIYEMKLSSNPSIPLL
jgi:hypothetical protein